ncbi:MAG: hypothetical protein Q7S39_11185 [Ignavibacteria bacterium]|nr:hypothetical protein [Ignavibacteria bacterium]
MKTLLLIFTISSFVFTFTSCQKTESPTESISFTGGEYTGTFSVTFKNYQNSSPLTQNGKISIMFSDSSYNYSATVEYSSEDSTYTFLTDRGCYSNTEDKIVMNDISWKKMDPRWHNSLYLVDSFTIKIDVNQIEILQDNSFANWKLNLVLKTN